MLFGRISQISVLIIAIFAGLDYFSFWWTLIPVFLAGSLSLSNGPGYERVRQANEEGRIGVFPAMLASHILPWLIVGAIVYWITSWIAG